MASRWIVPLTLALSLGGNPGSAPAGFILNFDESGNGSVTINGGTFSNPGFLQVDPNTGVSTVTYFLPENVASGHVLINEQNGTVGNALDFYTQSGQSYMAFYSTVGGGAAADVGIPFGSGSVVATEDGAESFTYAPKGATYNGLSNPAPEPSTLSLAGVGACALFALRRWRSRAWRLRLRA